MIDTDRGEPAPTGLSRVKKVSSCLIIEDAPYLSYASFNSRNPDHLQSVSTFVVKMLVKPQSGY